jgi:Ni/Fe-hydrogenase subunit HybB-like protein
VSHGRRTPSQDQALGTITGRIPGTWLLIWLAAIALGFVGFFLAVGPTPQRAWMTLWFNFLFWTALAMGGVVFSAILQAAKGNWGKPFRRLAEGAAAFLPFSFVLFVLLYFGSEYVLVWLGPVETLHLNRTWLTQDGVFIRNGILLAILYIASFVFLWYSLRADAPLVAPRLSGWRKALVGRLSNKWRGDEIEVERCMRRIARLGPFIILAWVSVLSVLSFDLIMSLVPGFISIVWGPYYFIGGWLCLLSLVALMANHYNGRFGGEPLWGQWDFHDLGKLMFAFVVFWTYLWFAQFLVVWYGNLPREANFFLTRTAGPFSAIYWLQMVLIFGLPFVFLLGRKPKMRSRWLAFVALIILTGFWIERFNLVVPSVWEGSGVPLGWQEILISVGFVGLFGLCYALFASTFPKVPIRDTIARGSAGQGP